VHVRLQAILASRLTRYASQLIDKAAKYPATLFLAELDYRVLPDEVMYYTTRNRSSLFTTGQRRARNQARSVFQPRDVRAVFQPPSHVSAIPL
jgi:hypothetical protein